MKKILSLVIFITTLQLYGQNTSQYFAGYSNNIKYYGMADSSGTIFTLPEYTEVYQQKEGFIRVEKTTNGKRKYGFNYPNGSSLIMPVYDYADDFSEGFALVAKDIGGGKRNYGFINKSGLLQIARIYENAYKFIDGVAAVKKDGKYFFIDKKGNQIGNNSFEYANEHVNGFSVVQAKDATNKLKYGLVDKKANYILKNEYDYISPSYYGNWIATKYVMLNNENVKQSYIVNVKGDFVNKQPLEDLQWKNSREGFLTYVKRKEADQKIYGLVDVKDKKYNYETTDPYFDLNDGVIKISKKMGSTKYYDLDGKLLFETPYSYLKSDAFYEGLAYVEIHKTQSGYLDKNGNMVISCGLNHGYNFSNGTALVTNQERLSSNPGSVKLIDKTGKTLISSYGEAIKTNDGKLIVKDNNISFIIDKNSKSSLTKNLPVHVKLKDAVIAIASGNYANAADLLSFIENENYTPAQYWYAFVLCFGNKIDSVKGVALYEKAANANFYKALTDMGYMYALGKFVPANGKKAIEMYAKAAKQNGQSNYSIGKIYQEGLGGLTINVKEAIKYFEMACDAGSSSAFVDLGKIYAEGNGVTKNIIKAKELFTIAKELEHPNAEAELKKLQ
jgi:hypothetical protein